MDVEFRVVSDRREGLLLTLGQLVIAHGFALLRQRMAGGEDGVVLTMLVRGPQQNLATLEECVATHPLVSSFEATRPHEAMPDPATPSPTPPHRCAATPPCAADSRRIDALVPHLTREYPNIFVPLLELERELPDEHRELALLDLGQRIGAWVQARDFAAVQTPTTCDAVRRVALPAMRQIVQAQLQGEALHVSDSPFCHRGDRGACCHFLRGMLGGLLGGAHGPDAPRAVETRCRNEGAQTCVFEFQRSVQAT
ncbi:4-vinyl reductase [Lysobacter auxotrophicus]|uniref:4-vinyl reductase n=1 Tax=Lysobacter auxotrophicus TaxID=2992573 RepID=A0ABN6UF22_9GAMM|nr:4-vinyl reductase [Lysobacter auxotrophicus]